MFAEPLVQFRAWPGSPYDLEVGLTGGPDPAMAAERQR